MDTPAQPRHEPFRRAFLDAPIGMAILSADGRCLHVNQALCDLLGYTAQEIIGTAWEDRAHPADRGLDRERRQDLVAGPIGRFHLDRRFVTKRGKTLWALQSVSLVRDDQGCPDYFVVHVQDITERKQQEDQLRHLALHDPLTGVPNRAHFFDRLTRALAEARRRRAPVAVLLVDLNGFKAINDSLGHAAGDALLVAVAHRLGGCLRAGETLARFGGDEFAVLLPTGAGEADASRTAARIIDAMSVPFELHGRSVSLGASVGIAVGDPRRLGPDDLLREADASLYRSKGSHPAAQPNHSAPGDSAD